MSETLRECPFCGGEGELNTWDDVGACVICLGCTARVDIQDTEPAAIAAWNRRTGDDDGVA